MKAIVTGGGTGGHIYPAVSIAKEIKSKYRDAEILFVGTEIGLESKIVPKEGFELKTIKVRGFQRKLSLSNIVAVKEAAVGLLETRKLIKEFKPDIVIGTGGYVCGSVLLSAALMDVPTLIHEQNAFPGITNKILARFVDKVALNFSEAQQYFYSSKKLIVTGNPIRKDMMTIQKTEGLRALGFKESLPVVFVTGGSRGAKKLNESIMPIAEACLKNKNFQLLHMTGDTQYASVLESYKAKGIPVDTSFIKVVPYLHNMPHALAASDIIISRCGASTLSEITALGKPSILIPYPYATDNHQEFNGRALEKNGAAVVILERDLTDSLLHEELMNLLSNPEKLKQMGGKSRGLGKPDASGHIMNIIDGLLSKNKKKA